jgi:hypothetical protein
MRSQSQRIYPGRVYSKHLFLLDIQMTTLLILSFITHSRQKETRTLAFFKHSVEPVATSRLYTHALFNVCLWERHFPYRSPRLFIFMGNIGIRKPCTLRRADTTAYRYH